MSFIPDSISFKLRFGPMTGVPEVWDRMVPVLRAHLDPWWSDVGRWFQQFHEESMFSEGKTVDTILAEARDMWEKDNWTSFGSASATPEHPKVDVNVSFNGREGPRDAEVDIFASWGSPDRERFRAAQRVLRAIFWDLINAFRPVVSIKYGTITLNCSAIPLPDVGDLRMNMLLLVEPKQKFLAQFDDPTVLERVALPEQYELDELLVLGRGTEAATTTEMAAACLHDTFELARAAKKDAVCLELPPTGWGPEEYELLEDGHEQQLHFVGYHPGLKIAEYSCAISSSQVHLRPKEIIEVCFCGARGRLPDGRPLDEVRVVFVDRAAAYRERRPLCDYGVKVCFLGEDGELVEACD